MNLTSADPNRTLPAGVTELLPTDATEYADGAAVRQFNS